MVSKIRKRISYLELRQIADSGQCFRMNQEENGRFSIISGEHYLEIEETPSGEEECPADIPERGGGSARDGASLPASETQPLPGAECRTVCGGELPGRERVFFFYCPEEELGFWEHYFDLEHDYGSYIASVRKRDSYLVRAAMAGSGIRILNQDPWEMIITFVISQQKTIPKIREAVEALSRQFGTRRESVLPSCGPGGSADTRAWYSFPSPEQLSAASMEDLLNLKLGYRAKYIYRLCQDAVNKSLDLNRLKDMGYEEAMEYLNGFYGIGKKVANCICLFGLHHIEAFPVDTWIEQILMEEYYKKKKKKYDGLPKSRLYGEMIQDHFGMYRGYAGVMQQYIFYYERVRRGKVR